MNLIIRLLCLVMNFVILVPRQTMDQLKIAIY
jgi:hypothetical protein